jgi:hypothetical protein
MPSPNESLRQDTQTLLKIFLPAGPAEIPPGKYSRIPPLCIPQLPGSFDAPFARGFSDQLHDSLGISQTDFLSFLDGFNLAFIASPPTWIIDSSEEDGIRTEPYRWTWLKTSQRKSPEGKKQIIISRSITDRYLRTANEYIFAPRGLSARICTTSATALLIRNGTQDGESLPLELDVPPPYHDLVGDSSWMHRVSGWFGAHKSRWRHETSSRKRKIRHNLPYAGVEETALWLLIAPREFGTFSSSDLN